MSQVNRVVVTGAPGTGKSTVLDLLHKQSYPVIPEMARQLIEEQQAIGSSMVPWDDHPRFGVEMFKRQVEQYKEAKEGWVFFDRGILDNLAYMRRDSCPNISLEEESKSYTYFPDVFLFPAWDEIYNLDNVRWENLSLMKEIDKALREMYERMGYNVIEVPKLNPQERLHFILNSLNIHG
jgi:predicted ATPase